MARYQAEWTEKRDQTKENNSLVHSLRDISNYFRHNCFCSTLSSTSRANRDLRFSRASEFAIINIREYLNTCLFLSLSRSRVYRNSIDDLSKIRSNAACYNFSRSQFIKEILRCFRRRRFYSYAYFIFFRATSRAIFSQNAHLSRRSNFELELAENFAPLCTYEKLMDVPSTLFRSRPRLVSPIDVAARACNRHWQRLSSWTSINNYAVDPAIAYLFFVWRKRDLSFEPRFIRRT